MEETEIQRKERDVRDYEQALADAKQACIDSQEWLVTCVARLHEAYQDLMKAKNDKTN